MILIAIVFVLSLIAVLKFITWYRPRIVDYYVTFPYTLTLQKKYGEGGDDERVEFSDDLLNRLTKDSTPDPSVKKYSMRISINMADVIDYAEWTTCSYEDEKIFSNAVCVRFVDGSEMILNVSYDYFDAEFNNYLSTR